MSDNLQNSKRKLPEKEKIENKSKGKPFKKNKFYNDGNENSRFKSLEISVVIPLLNEEESLKELSDKLETVLTKMTQNSWEVIYIDDGSTDSSLEILRMLNKQNNKFKYISFRRNYGKSAALAVGFELAKGKYVATMDADLQDDPDELPNLMLKIQDGYDLVSGWKKKRYDPITKTVPSKLFNYVTSRVSGVKLHDFNCGLKLYRSEVIKTVKVYGEMHRYIPALAFMEGFKVTEIPVIHHKRKYGKTKYGMSRFINGFLDLLTMFFTTRYTKQPLHFFGFWGTVFTALGITLNLYLTFQWLFEKTYLSNRPMIFLGMLLIIVGVQLFSMGLLGEMITKNNIQGKNSLNYSIKEKTLG